MSPIGTHLMMIASVKKLEQSDKPPINSLKTDAKALRDQEMPTKVNEAKMVVLKISETMM